MTRPSVEIMTFPQDDPEGARISRGSVGGVDMAALLVGVDMAALLAGVDMASDLGRRPRLIGVRSSPDTNSNSVIIRSVESA